MKNNFKFYAIIWALSLAMFNVIVFVTPAEIAGVSKFTGSFWIAYTFITLAFLGQLGCAFIAFKGDAKKLFYNIPLISISYTGLGVMLIVGTIFMAIPVLPNWLAIIACFIALAVNVIAVIKASAAINVVTDIDKKIKTKTFFIKSLTIDVETVVAKATTTELKTIAKKVCDEIRYSDPMSDDALASVESQITIKFEEFADAVGQNDVERTQKLANEVIVLLKNRNNKCKFLK